jgi:hypothetical protein
MKISANSPLEFQGRQISLSQAKELNTFVQRNFPYESSWKLTNVTSQNILAESGYYSQSMSLKELKKVQYKLKVLEDLAKKSFDKLNICREKYYQFIRQPFEYFRHLVVNTNKYQVANCGEMAKLVYLVARINDVDDKDLELTEIGYRNKRGNNKQCIGLDHIITNFKNENSQIGIDSLLGETDYLQNLKHTYQNKYKSTFKIPDHCNIEFLPEGFGGQEHSTNPSKDELQIDKKFIMPRLDDDEAKELKKIYSSFILYK